MAKKTVVETIDKVNRFTTSEDVQPAPEREAEREMALDLAVAMMRGHIPTDRELTPTVEAPPEDMQAVSDAAAALVTSLADEISMTSAALANAQLADNAVEVVRLTQRLAELRAQLYEARKAELAADIGTLDYLFAQWQTALQSAKKDHEAARNAAKAAVIAEHAMQRRIEIIGNHMTNNRNTHATFTQQSDELRRVYRAMQKVH